ncbi:uncharacterized protein LOC135396464 isoform X2 [Ornithodoros turicata]|uniref:uncharacterized protein LOC135396464 isoform X2 n=1 Tax=Ornithodoros turicata TaxID=34597 RepID=UPI00313A3DE7
MDFNCWKASCWRCPQYQATFFTSNSRRGADTVDKLGLDVLGRDISLDGLLLDQCRLSGETVTFSNVKLAKTLSVEAAQVTCRGVLQSGDIRLQTQKLLAERILVSRTLEVSASEVRVNAVYTDSLLLDCQGLVDLGTVHGYGTLTTGDIRVGSIEGNFDVITTSGKVSLLVARTDKLTVRTTTGDVCLYFLTPYSTYAQGHTVYRHEDIPNGTDNDATVRVFSQGGKVYLAKQDWATHIVGRQA